MYVITGATGNIGGVIADKLLSNGQNVRALGRDPNKLKRLVNRGADVLAGSVDDAAFLAKAFQGAKAVFSMIPSDPTVQSIDEHEDLIGEAIAAALRESRVPHIVNLSSLGGEVPKGTGPIAGLHRQEERLNQLPSNVLHLRPTYFLENFYGSIPMIKEMGINGSSISADLKLPMIATRDIGEAAADALLKLNFQGKSTRLLLGERDLTMVEVTKILGTAIGNPGLPYIHFSYEDAEKGMIASGISPDVARSYNEMSKALNEGLISWARTRENTTPTSVEEFAKQFAHVYQSN
jgi:uncharacterized protein YbjT (DUF2867 family)